MRRSAARRSAATALALTLALAGRAAHADDPRDVFGLRPKPPPPPIDCGDGRDFGCAIATDPLDDSAPPFALSTWLSSAYLRSLPVADATHDAVAHWVLGAGRDAAGPTFGGANGLENRWTIDGAPTESVRTGAAETRIPLTFLDGMRITTGGFAARDRTSTGGTIDARLVRGGDRPTLDAQVWVGWSAKPAQPAIPTDTFQLRRGQVAPGPTVSASVVATGPLGDAAGGKLWYAAGLAPQLAWTDFQFTAARLVDANHDGIPDGLPGPFQSSLIEDTARTRLTYAVPALARIGLDRGAHALDLTLLASAASDARYLFNSTLQAGGIDRTTLVGDAIATWRGHWHDTRARVQLAWHRSDRRESAADPMAQGQPQLLSAYVPATLSEDPALAAACVDPDPSLFTQCPIPIGWFASGGAGPLVHTTADRPSITADVAHRFGNNVVRIGATGEDARLVTDTRFTGGEQIRSLFPGQTAVRRFIDADLPCSSDPTLPCPTVDHSELAYRTRYTAAYVEDTFRPAPNLVVDGGLRWELMWVGPVLHFSDELAPRLGASWDPLGGGRSRVWASMGRTFAIIPAGIGATILPRNRTVDDISSPFGASRSIDTGTPFAVTSGVQPVAQDEITTGAQVALARAVRATMWFHGKWLARGLETTPEGLDNPGRQGGTPAIRETQIVAAELSTSPTSALVLRAGYMYGRTVGSWTGAYNPNEGAVLFAGADFNVTSANQLGHLPTELGHRVYVEAERRGRVGELAVAFATRLTVASSPPRDVLGASDDGLIYLLPRGGDHGPLVSQANIRLAASWRGFDITLDLFDVFNRRDPTALDQTYAGGSIHPIDGGTAADLVFLRNDEGKTPVRSASFATATAFAGPFSAVLGAHRAF